jgi:two-component system nitrogen regulation response regulator GlnG
MPSLLIIDDEPSVRYSFQTVFESGDVKILTAGTAVEGLARARDECPDVILLDIQLPDRSGLEVFRDLQTLDPKRPIIFITAYGTAETAIEAMKGGAFDYLIKPMDLEKVTHILERAFDAARLMHVPAELPAEPSADRIVGHSPVMQEMCKAIGRLAPQDVNVLILGESGTGKELVSRALYHHSKRADRPFLAINCAAIPETLLESELFGHEQGAFTGATRRRIGKFEQVSGGTLFLDEIGDMAPQLQAKILRVLQEQRFERVGGNETVQTHVRILAATNQDLEKLVAEGRFRKDLYYRLKVVTIQVPPLRAHLDDVPELSYYFLFRYNQQLGKDLRGFAPEALELLQNYLWPGNVRELQSVLKEAMLRASGHVLLPEFLPDALVGAPASPAPVASGIGFDLAAQVDVLLRNNSTQIYDKLLESVDRLVLPRILRHTHGNQTQASELLGLHRSTLRHKLRTLGLTFDRTLVEEESKDEGKAI